MNNNRCPHCGAEFGTSRTCSCIEVVYVGGQEELEPAIEFIIPGYREQLIEDIDSKLSDMLDRLRRIEDLLLYLEEDSHN